MRVAIYTLGCKVNQYETQAMEQELQRRGHTLVDFESPADAYIINTCSVTAVSDKKSRQMIRRAKSRNPQAVVAACGCYVQTHTPEAQELGIDLNYNVEIETASVLTKSADVRALSEEAQKLFALTARAADQYVLAYPELRAARGSSAWTEGPVIV